MASWFTTLSVGYLIWYAWSVFIKDKGNPGGLGLAVAVLAWGQIMSAVFDLL